MFVGIFVVCRKSIEYYFLSAHSDKVKTDMAAKQKNIFTRSKPLINIYSGVDHEGKEVWILWEVCVEFGVVVYFTIIYLGGSKRGCGTAGKMARNIRCAGCGGILSRSAPRIICIR